jgi:hypothetical protein
VRCDLLRRVADFERADALAARALDKELPDTIRKVLE